MTVTVVLQLLLSIMRYLTVQPPVPEKRWLRNAFSSLILGGKELLAATTGVDFPTFSMV